MIEIIKDAPIPKRNAGAKRKHQDLYYLVEMWEVGDSVVFDTDETNVHGTKVSNRANSLTAIAKRANQKITIRSNKKDSTVQIWRVE